jgi:hypothetical protein
MAGLSETDGSRHGALAAVSILAYFLSTRPGRAVPRVMNSNMSAFGQAIAIDWSDKV